MLFILQTKGGDHFIKSDARISRALEGDDEREQT